MDLDGVKRLVQGRGFTVVVEKPFVVVGDEEADVVRTRAESTIRWAVKRLRAQYFDKDPKGIVVWLFKDKASYRKHAWEFFRHKPGTPYGYFSDTERALIMNIATGGGTLIHEMVHLYVAANFPGCPSWFNEGLGSLYEQAADCKGKICGLTNWRLAGLKRAIRRGTVPSFRTLTSTTTDQFYDEDPGTNYAQARYLLYYLQQQGTLNTYYKRFHRNRATDPTGYRTLKLVLGATDMAVFKRRWEREVLALRFPE